MTGVSRRNLLLACSLLAALLPPASAQAPAIPASAASGAPAIAGAGAAASRPPSGAAESGNLAWYGPGFAGRRTANGEVFDPNALTMAHRTLPFGTLVRVTNPANQRSVVLRVNDRGPLQADRIGDVSAAAARRLGMMRKGVIHARQEVVDPGSAGIKSAAND